MKKNIFFIEEIHPKGMKHMRENANVIVAEDVERVKDDPSLKDAEAIVTRLRPVTREIIEACPKLEVIGRHGVGVDNIDLEAAKERGIRVINTPGANLISVVEYAVMAMMVLAKDVFRLDREMRKGNYDIRKVRKGIDVSGKKLGIIGLGSIGFELAKTCMTAFNMEVCAYDPLISEKKAREIGVSLYSQLNEMLPVVDFLSIHVPLVESTRHLIGCEELSNMKESAYLINCARGGVVDEAALYQALVKEQIAGAALDVYEIEPPLEDNPLFELEQVVCTPHIAGATFDAIIRMSESLARDIIKVLLNEKPEHELIL